MRFSETIWRAVIGDDEGSRLAAMIPLLIGDRRIDRGTLNKLVYFADAIHRVVYGQSISGARHIKSMHGPIAFRLPEIRHRLVGSAVLAEEAISDGMVRHFFCTVAADPGDLAAMRERFSAEELDTIDRVRMRLGHLTPTYLARCAHAYEPWLSQDFGEELDLERAVDDMWVVGWAQDCGLAPSGCKGCSQ